MKVRFRSTFFADLNEIYNYIADNFDDDLAKEKTDEIYRECLTLEDSPKLGKLYPYRKNYRYLTVIKKNIVFYKIGEEAIVVHRVFDKRRDYFGVIQRGE